MSPLWRNQLRVVLCPDQVIILGLGRGLRPKVFLQAILPCVPASDLPGWQPALDAFAYWLSSRDSNEMGKTDVTVILSSHFVRFAVMPFSSDVTRRDEQRILAQIMFEDIYGELSGQWTLEIGQGGYGEATLIAAVDTLLLDKITTLLNSSALRLNAITPYFVSAFNGFCGQLQASGGLFAVVETGLMVVAAFNNGQLFSVSRIPLNGQLEELLPILLQREALTSGLNPEAAPVYLHVAGRPDLKLRCDGKMAVHILQPLDRNGVISVVDASFDIVAGGT
ncbi:MAG: hypothetical protein Q7U37_02705 [Gallionella sp.]|nr:hypothetical protein [Gallionella sp.]